SGFAKRYNVAAESTGVEQLIWDFGKTLNSIKLAKENLTSAQCAFLEAQENTVLRAKTAYYDVLKAQLMLEVAREGLRQSQVHLERAEGFFEVGYRQKYDVTKAEVAVSNAKLDLVSAEKDYKLAKAALNNVMGNKDSADFAVEEIRGIEFADVDADMSLKTAMENRVELLKLQSQARAAQADLEVKKKGNWPTVTAGGAHQVSDTDTDGVGNVKSWNAGVSVNFPWFDGFRTKSQVEAAQASLKMAQYAIEDQALGITLQVQDAILGLREAKERFDVSEKLLQQSSENLEIASARYEEGLGSIIEVTDAETQLVSAKQSRASAISGYLSSRAKYDKSVGIISQSVK
ncbi:MAG TPA: TolC family protein, partial [Candidatus Omnitrophota bacterium]|nr:TolC family protein [Candidatus Omnitrophota bacterium]HRZ67619.1 TolC family protein [Candidatus Omnitrophota bacterium]